MEVLSNLFDKLQKVDPLVWAALAAYFAPYAQNLLNRVRDLGRSSNYVIALIVVPTVIASLTCLQSSHLLATLTPSLKLILTAALAAVVSQLKYGLSLKPKQDKTEELESLRAQLAPKAVDGPAVTPPEAGY